MKLRTTFRTALLLAALTPAARAIEMYWEPLPGRAKDIAVGADGSVWIVGSGVTNGDVYKWNGSSWVLIGGSGVLIAVGPQGDPWVVNFASDLYHRTNNQWNLVTQSGSATGVGVGADGTVLITGGSSCFCGPVSDQRLFRYQAGTSFTELPGGGRGAVIVGRHPKTFKMSDIGVTLPIAALRTRRRRRPCRWRLKLLSLIAVPSALA